jgi:hypothetical protein
MYTCADPLGVTDECLCRIERETEFTQLTTSQGGNLFLQTGVVRIVPGDEDDDDD